MRAAPLLAFLLLAPLASAQAADGTGPLAEVTLASALDDALHVVLVENGTRGQPARVPIERPSLDLVVVRAADVVPTEATRVVLRAPDGWGSAQSAGLLVFGRSLRVETRAAGSARVESAGLGEQGAEDAAYLARGVAYLAAQHPGAPRDLLVVRAPRALAGDGLVLDDAVLVADDASAEDLARLLVRLHQRYRVVELAPTSAAWFREGEERLQVATSLLAAGLRTGAQVDEDFTRARAVADPDAPLTEAPAGSTFARNKGLVVVRGLDAALRQATDGRAALADLLERLDATSARLDSAAIEREARALGGEPIAAFFERYVYGAEWPATSGARDAADVFVRGLRVEPARAAAGEQVVAVHDVVNRGTQPSELDLVLTLDGAPYATVPIRLAVGVRANGSLPFAVRAPGDHVVALGHANATLHVLAPGRLALVRASATPAEPRAGEPFTLLVYVANEGGSPARGRVSVLEGGKLLQRTTEAIIDGGSTDALTLPMSFDEPGLHALEIRLDSEAGGGTIEHLVPVPIGGTEDREAPTLAPLAILLGAVAAAAWRRPSAER